MIKRVFGAAIRAIAVSAVIVAPTVLLPTVDLDAMQIVVFLAVLGGLLIFVEYFSAIPSLIEFRNAPPFNRLRFMGVCAAVLLLTVLLAGQLQSGSATTGLHIVASQIAGFLDFPFSPVRLLVLAAPNAATQTEIFAIHILGGVAYACALCLVCIYFFLVRVMDWPMNKGAFNVLINMPLFDPTTGGDVISRMRRDAQLNLSLGFLVPFLLPAILKLSTPFVVVLTLDRPQTLIWVIVIWAFLSASLAMRGFALMRIATLIEDKRKRAYAQHDTNDTTRSLQIV